MAKVLQASGRLDRAVTRELSRAGNLAAVQAAIEKKGKKAIAVPMRNEARIHYANMLSNVVDFIEESGMDNGHSGFAQFPAIGAGGSVVPVRSRFGWKPLSDRYRGRKGNGSLWRNTGSLQGYAQEVRSKTQVVIVNMATSKRIKSVRSRFLGGFTFNLRFQKLPKVLEQSVRKSFITGKAENPANLEHISVNRKSLSRLIFLERYKPASGRGGGGRPMLSQIAGKLGKVFRADVAKLKKGKVR